MGTLSSAVKVLGQFGNMAGSISSIYSGYNAAKTLLGDSEQKDALRREQELAMRQLIEAQNAGLQKAEEQAGLDRAKITADAQNAETARRAALKRAMARQKVQYGASGISAADGSGEAVLLGLFEESDQERQAREKLDGLRNQAIDLDIADRNRINVLQRTQLQERQKLDTMLL